MAEKLGIVPPDNIFVGIDDNFFVTEHPVKMGEELYTGPDPFRQSPAPQSAFPAAKPTPFWRTSWRISAVKTRSTPTAFRPSSESMSITSKPSIRAGSHARVFHFMFSSGIFTNFRSTNSVANGSSAPTASVPNSPRRGASPKPWSRSPRTVAYRQKVQKHLFEKDETSSDGRYLNDLRKAFPLHEALSLMGTELGRSRHASPFRFSSASCPPTGEHRPRSPINPQISKHSP